MVLEGSEWQYEWNEINKHVSVERMGERMGPGCLFESELGGRGFSFARASGKHSQNV